ncbi:MAG: TetR/AcrR family transcriptional regulator [bacterium]|nr:TetR/AcrR family transcriptional regulator [bacterium]
MSTDALPSPALRRADGPQGRLRILDEAAVLFLERGYAATSLRAVAAAAGMKAGSLYYHFESKEALFLAILQRGIDVMVDAFRLAQAQTREVDGRARIAAHVRAHLAAMFEHGPYTASHVTTFPTAPDSVREAMVPARDAYEAMWTGLLEELAARGEIAADTPIGLARLLLFGAMNSTLDWYDPERGDLDTFSHMITRQLWSGLSAAENVARRDA